MKLDWAARLIVRIICVFSKYRKTFSNLGSKERKHLRIQLDNPYQYFYQVYLHSSCSKKNRIRGFTEFNKKFLMFILNNVKNVAIAMADFFDSLGEHLCQ